MPGTPGQPSLANTVSEAGSAGEKPHTPLPGAASRAARAADKTSAEPGQGLRKQGEPPEPGPMESKLEVPQARPIVVGDIVIVLGALAYRTALGHLDIAPTRLSKLNTFIEFTVLLLVMAAAAGWVDAGTWMPTVFLIVLATVVASGAQYVWLWGRKAIAERSSH